MAPMLHVLISLLLAAAAVVARPPPGDPTADADGWHVAELEADDGFNASSTCNGRFGDCNEDEEMAVEPGASRRLLINRRVRHINYDVLKKNRVPCGQRGATYFDCHGHVQVNPYRRGCTLITQCARILYP